MFAFLSLFRRVLFLWVQCVRKKKLLKEKTKQMGIGLEDCEEIDDRFRTQCVQMWPLVQISQSMPTCVKLSE